MTLYVVKGDDGDQRRLTRFAPKKAQKTLEDEDGEDEGDTQ